MKKVVIIPARYSSSRLPGKPLQDIAGKPMIIRVCEAVDASLFSDVVVATDDKRIEDCVKRAGYEVVMTKEDHVSGTDRLQEAASKLGLAAEDIIINLQGDEPLMPVDNLSQVARLLENSAGASVATLYETVAVKEAGNPNIVKLVEGKNHRVLYFSRAGIPFDRDNVRTGADVLKRHVGVYAYRKSALDEFVTYPEGELESLEKLEQLRFMENGHSIVAEKSVLPIPVGVDTAEDLEAVRKLFEESA
ncbi:3-deoxy-manno-octulosonate cytidylyltransferase [Reinekea marinisedimentorum]|uniref:3-deoxy-manno-octulosonate cytidylyltransferase n=1 Tax=Reinekea marinisedimentorum TaxID=230495 RepID=A0A4R3IAP4_9GAMM|nr:3-deoxy-manno-octulosonate cytidylyltransferase [Reinekea marinisedimentorum]TCS42569.1 3-deoxy-manno-octulosonate cytidylyltransferase (CMP-KDO synthetase) [Reinekea marinisedimentorum]